MERATSGLNKGGQFVDNFKNAVKDSATLLRQAKSANKINFMWQYKNS